MSKHDAHLMATAGVWATASQAKRKQVGAVIAKADRIIATGYNGTLPGFDNTCEGADGLTLPHVMHAEANAILFAAKHGLALDQCTIYSTLSPCMECAKMIAAAGISRLVCHTLHSDTSGLELLKQAGVTLTLLDMESFLNDNNAQPGFSAPD